MIVNENVPVDAWRRIPGHFAKLTTAARCRMLAYSILPIALAVKASTAARRDSR